MDKIYAAIDLKSFYASVECVERGLNPLTTNLVVADKSRTEKTICLAVSPSLKSYGISGRPRLFEVIQQVKKINAQRIEDAALKKEQEKEKKLQESLLSIKKKYGKNAILRGINYEEGATTIERNEQIGGHKA